MFVNVFLVWAEAKDRGGMGRHRSFLINMPPLGSMGWNDGAQSEPSIYPTHRAMTTRLTKCSVTHKCYPFNIIWSGLCFRPLMTVTQIVEIYSTVSTYPSRGLESDVTPEHNML